MLKSLCQLLAICSLMLLKNSISLGSDGLEQKDSHTADAIKFGAALTDSSLFVAEFLSDEQIEASLKPLTHIRISLGPSDFSPSYYSWERDLYFDEEFIHRTKIIQLQRILRIRPDLIIYASSWQPPKSYVREKDQGKWAESPQFLNSEALENFGDYLAELVEGYKHRGIPIHYLSVQNEPLNYNQSFPNLSMRMDSNTQADLIKATYAGLESRGLQQETKILAHDHNPDPDGIQNCLEVGGLTRNFIAGFAFHNYTDPENIKQIDRVRDEFPTLEIHHTEISASAEDDRDQSKREFSRYWHKTSIQLMKEVGSQTYTYWNLFLNPSSGPSISVDQGHHWKASPLVWVEEEGVTKKGALYELFDELQKP